MSRFDHYFQMNVGDVIEYTLETVSYTHLTLPTKA